RFRRIEQGQSDAPRGRDVGAAESGDVPDGRWLRVAFRRDHCDRWRRLPRDRRVLHRARQDDRRRLGARARDDQGAKRQGPRRPQRMTSATGAKTEPRPAATVILLRDAPAGPEVFMLQRTRGAAFLPGAYVFPGGAIDASDRDPRAARRVTGLTDSQASVKLGLAEGGLAYWIAAARECFEEAGILIATQQDGRPVAPERARALEEWREALNAGKRVFADLLEQEDLYVPADGLAYFSHWITAAGRPRRFNTRFFVARAPLGQDGAHDQSETVHSFWISPREALERHERNEIEVIFPTRTSLADIAKFTTASAALEYAHGLGDIEV